LFLSKPFFPLNVSSIFFSSFYFRSLALPWCFTPSVSPLFLSNNCRSLSRSTSLSLSNENVSAPLFSSFFLLFLSCTPSVFIGRGREGHPALPSHGRAWWHAWGRLLHSRPCLCRAWPFWREGVVVSVKGQVGALVFWVLGERERIKKWEGKCFFFPCSLRVQGKKKAYGAVQNGTVCFLFFFFFFQ